MYLKMDIRVFLCYLFDASYWCADIINYPTLFQLIKM